MRGHANESGGDSGPVASLICKLWEADKDRFRPGQDYVIDLQNGKSVGANHDAASRPLFVSVEKPKFMRIRSFASFYDLLDNYVDQCGVKETVTAHEKREEDAFIRAVLDTECSRIAHEFVTEQGWWRGSYSEWGQFLQSLWFALYRRDTHGDSSAFEHVFLGEIRNGAVIGFHNWVSIFLAERKKLIDYRGFIWPRRRNSPTPSDLAHIVKVQFTCKDTLKPMSTVLLGVTPEFELMLYTVVFLSGSEKIHCTIDDVPCAIVVRRMQRGDRTVIGTAYVDALE